MSDRIFAFLLRLYPPSFREKYSEEARQLYRDRLRDEIGLSRKARLYYDLLADAVTGLPRAWRTSYTSAAAPTLAAGGPSAPLFRMLEKEPLRPGAVFIGSTLSLIALFAFGAIMDLPTAVFRSGPSLSRLSPIESVLEPLNRAVPQGNSDSAVASGAMADASATQSARQNPSTISLASAPNLDAAERGRVIQSVAANLVAHYYDRDRAQQASAELLSLQQHGYYDSIVDGQMLASRLTFALQRSTQDRHIKIEFTRNVLPNGPPRPSVAAVSQYRAVMQQENCSFEKVEILRGDIGYLKLNSFSDPAICSPTAQSALARLRHSTALIIDLRANTGGFPEMVATMAAPLFDRPVRWYNPRQGDGSGWLSPARENSLAGKPVYILTSPLTLSAAEQFTYNLKMLHRATIIGDTTGGGAHIGVFHRIDDHFGMGIPETPIHNPYGQPDWEGIGVEPDVKVAPRDALTTAEEMARKHSAK